jgi:hypothetical protein
LVVLSGLAGLFAGGTIGNSIAGIISGVVELGAALSWMSGFFSTSLIPSATAFQGALATLNAWMFSFSSVASTVVSAVSGAFASLAGALSLPVIAGITAVVGFVWFFWDEVKDMGSAFMRLFSALGELVVVSLSNAFDEVAKQAIKLWNIIYNTFIAPFEEEIAIITSFFSQAWDLVLGKVKTFFKETFDAIKGIVSSVIDGIRGFLNSITSTVNKMAEGVENAIPDDSDQPPRGGGFPPPSNPPGGGGAAAGGMVSQNIRIGGNTVQMPSTGDDQRDRQRASREARKLQRQGVNQAKTVFDTGER